MGITLGERRGDGAAAILAVLWAGGIVETQGGCGGLLRLDSDGVTDGLVVGIHQGWSYFVVWPANLWPCVQLSTCFGLQIWSEKK